MDSPVQLAKLLMKEISGVDEPANESPGWAVMKAAESKTLGAESAETKSSESSDDSTTILARVRKLVMGEKDEVLDMDEAALKAVLDERDDALVAKVSEVVKSLIPTPETPAADETGETAPVAKADETPAPAETPAPEASTASALTAEDVTKAISEALAPHNEILEAFLGRIEALEGRSATRKSIAGQETGGNADETPAAASLGDAFSKALAGEVVTLT